MNAIAFHQHRQRDADTLNKIKELSDAALKPQQIQTYLLQQDPSKLITRKDITNDREQMRRDNLQGMTPTQAMMLALDKYNEQFGGDSTKRYRYTVHTHPATEQPDYLFWMHPASLALLKENYDLVLIDCTYKTNRYNMPLCHITGRTSSGKTFDIAYCFVNNECEETYTFIVDDLASIFQEHLPDKKPTVSVTDKERALKNALKASPLFSDVRQIICQWHVCMNVLTHAQTQWPEKLNKSKEEKKYMRELRQGFMTRFKILLHCSGDVFNAIWAKIVEDYTETAPKLVKYIREEWIDDCKEEVFDGYLTDALHFGHKSTSSNEGAHAAIKSYLLDCTGDLLTVVSAIHTKIQADIHEIQAGMAKTYSSKPGSFQRIHLLDDIIDLVTVYGLKKVEQQYNKLQAATEEAPLGRCTHYFTKEMGLPCAHVLQLLIQRKQKINLTIIHPHWWYFRSGTRPTHAQAVVAAAPTPGTLLAMQEPARIRQGRGRPKRDDKSTQRLPSAFELTQGRRLTSRAAPVASAPPPPPPAPSRAVPSPQEPAEAAPDLQEPAPTAPVTAKKRTRGPDKQPRKRRTQVEKNKEVEVAAGARDTMVKQRELAAARERAVDRDVATDNW